MRRLIVEAVSDSEEETMAFGERLGRALRSRAVVGLVGPLGAGKTRLVQGIVRGAGYDGRVRSPTFALLHEYRGRIPIRHIDLYRLDRLDEGTAGEWEEAMETDGLTLVEWSDRFEDFLPPGAVEVSLAPEGQTRRRIRLSTDLPGRAIDTWRLR
jgi:tRNA threonylcarbamoyladenosine biosynthesis protein TsaE